MNLVRVLLVDDQEAFMRALVAVLDATPGFVVVGRAATGEESLELAGELRPGLVLMDVNLPGMDGIEATRRLRELSSPPVVATQAGSSGAASGTRTVTVVSPAADSTPRVPPTASTRSRMWGTERLAFRSLPVRTTSSWSSRTPSRTTTGCSSPWAPSAMQK